MNQKSEQIFSVHIDENHPACNGHFEGNPLLPGAVTLEYVRVACRTMYPEKHIRSFNRVKFTYSLKPGETLAIHLNNEKMGILGFQCFDSKNHQIAIGNLVVD